MIAVLNQYLVQNGVQTKAGLGNINPKLYSMAASGKSGVFHDITTGNNIVPCVPNTAECVNAGLGVRPVRVPRESPSLRARRRTVASQLWVYGRPGLRPCDGPGIGGRVQPDHRMGQHSGYPHHHNANCEPAVIVASGSAVLTATVQAASGTRSPTGPVSFTLGSEMLGTAMLAGSGGSSTGPSRFPAAGW